MQHSMISKLGVCKRFMVVFWERSLLRWFLGVLALVKMHIQGTRWQGLVSAAPASSGGALLLK